MVVSRSAAKTASTPAKMATPKNKKTPAKPSMDESVSIKRKDRDESPLHVKKLKAEGNTPAKQVDAAPKTPLTVQKSGKKNLKSGKQAPKTPQLLKYEMKDGDDDESESDVNEEKENGEGVMTKQTEADDSTQMGLPQRILDLIEKDVVCRLELRNFKFDEKVLERTTGCQSLHIVQSGCHLVFQDPESARKCAALSHIAIPDDTDVVRYCSVKQCIPLARRFPNVHDFAVEGLPLTTSLGDLFANPKVTSAHLKRNPQKGINAVLTFSSHEEGLKNADIVLGNNKYKLSPFYTFAKRREDGSKSRKRRGGKRHGRKQ